MRWTDQDGNMVEIINGICACGQNLDINNKGVISTPCKSLNHQKKLEYRLKTKSKKSVMELFTNNNTSPSRSSFVLCILCNLNINI